jgi:kinesin family member 15
LVLHSEAQSLLFQEKVWYATYIVLFCVSISAVYVLINLAVQYNEMEHMVSRQRFGPHESYSETVPKTEKPSGRARGSSSPFRCISSIIQQMNSERDQEILVARQRIEELEGLVSCKQKEVSNMCSFDLWFS